MQHFLRFVAPVSVSILALLAAAPAPAQAAPPDSVHRDRVAAALQQSGSSEESIAHVLEHPELWAGVATSQTVSTRQATGASSTGSFEPMSLGSCSGSRKTFSKSLTFNNTFGQRLATHTVSTTFCYNGKKVTYGTTSRSTSVSTLGSLLTRSSWNSPNESIDGAWRNGIYSAQGRYKAINSLTFKMGCDPTKTVCAQTVYPWFDTRGYFDGDSLATANKGL